MALASFPSTILNCGSSPSSKAWRLRMRPHMPWMVLIQAESTWSACSRMPHSRSVERTRSRISCAAASVNVITSTCDRSSRKGLPSVPEPGESAHATLRVRVKVLPDPAPASTNSGSSRVVTILRCSSFSPSRSKPLTW
jgi:hypothetical protein